MNTDRHRWVVADTFELPLNDGGLDVVLCRNRCSIDVVASLTEQMKNPKSIGPLFIEHGVLVDDAADRLIHRQRSALLSVFMAASFLLLTLTAAAQNVPHLKHRVFAYWGYNRAQFTTSDIHFTGSDYDFILHDVVAKDKPEAFTLNNYFNPKYIWIPQYNYRVGWFLTDKWSFSLGLDHMKYVMAHDQRVQLTGIISRERSPAYATSGETGEVRLTPDFLTYEHTDGLNLLALDADHYDRIWSSKNGKQAIYFTEGLFVGPVIPRTDVRLFGEGINNKFHLAGYGAGAQVGVFGLFWYRVFLRANVRAGYIELPSVLTTGKAEDRASQHFWFVQENVVLGVLIGRTKAARSAD